MPDPYITRRSANAILRHFDALARDQKAAGTAKARAEVGGRIKAAWERDREKVLRVLAEMLGVEREG